MSLGFKDILWSEADRYWNYGLWQPRYLLDPFRPVQMGLPGLYFNHEGETSILFLFSYFYLPDVIIYPKLKNNQVTSKNPFFVESFQKFHWNIDTLDFFQINRFFKPLLAFQVKHFIESSSVAFSYAYKPVNQLQYSVFVEGINLSDSVKNRLTINQFKYSVLSHHLASLEGESSLSENLSLFASLFYEKPEKITLEKGWVSDPFESHLTFSLLAYFEEKWEEHTKTLFTLGWTKTLPSRSQDEMSNVVTESLEPSFGRGFDWKEALSASIEYQNESLFQGFLFRFRANYALDNKFSSIALENYFYFTPHIRMYVSGDAPFQLSDENLNKDKSSVEKYKNLHRLLVGMQYVF